MSRRPERLASLIREELAQMILHELNDPRLTGFPSITRVKVAGDLSVADVYVTVMGTPGHQNAALNALKHSAGMMRSKLTKSLSIRTTPFISFHLDDLARKEIEVLELLHKAKLESDELERKRAIAAGEIPPEDAVSAPTEADGPEESPPTSEA